MTTPEAPVLPEDLKRLLTKVSDDSAERVYQQLLKDTDNVFPWNDKDTRLGMIYLIAYKLTNLVTQKIKENTL